MKTRVLILVSILIAGSLSVQADWSKINYAKEYKRKVNIYLNHY